jgi:hypothetical protein
MKFKLIITTLLFFFTLTYSFAKGNPEDPDPVDTVKAPEFKKFGFIDANMYYDTRKGSTFTINSLALLSKKFSYFGFINFQQGSFGGEKVNDFDFYYSEQNLTYSPFKKIPIDFNVQMVFIGGSKNDKVRFAPSWRVHNTPVIDKFFKKIHMNYGINFHVLQFGYDAPLNDFTWQMEHFYNIRIAPKATNNRIYISGFADHTMGGPIAKGLVMEHQVGVRLFNQFHAVCEYRYFSYLPDKYKSGWGLGFEYLILFNN